MQSSKIEFGPLESRLLAWAQWRGVECVATVEMAKALRLGEEQARQLMKRMGKKGLAIALRKGLWLLPCTLPPGGRWTPAPAIVLRRLFEAVDGSYQETGPGALQYHGLSEQMANVTTVYNTRLSGRSMIGGLEFQWIKVAESRLGHFDAAALPERQVGSLARVVFDAVYDSARFGTLPTAYAWIRDRVSSASFVEELAECAVAHGDAAACRRLGTVFELLGVAGKARNRLHKALPPLRTHIALVPGRSRAGKLMTTWGVILNERGWLDV
jgi:predicted transcriptional regulator of viral defense system